MNKNDFFHGLVTGDNIASAIRSRSASRIKNINIGPNGGLTLRRGVKPSLDWSLKEYKFIKYTDATHNLVGLVITRRSVHLCYWLSVFPAWNPGGPRVKEQVLVEVSHGDININALWNFTGAIQGVGKNELLLFGQGAPLVVIRHSGRVRSPTLTKFVYKTGSDSMYRAPQISSRNEDLTVTSSGTTGSVRLTFSAASEFRLKIGTKIRFHGGECTVTRVITDRIVSARVSAPIASAASTTEWSFSVDTIKWSWYDHPGPATAGWFQGRLVLAGFGDTLDQIWMSKSGRPDDFDLDDGLDDDGISFRISGSSSNGIFALSSGSSLLIYSADGFWRLRGSPVTPSSLVFEQVLVKPCNGSLGIIEVGASIIFVGADDRIFEMHQDESGQGYIVTDLSAQIPGYISDIRHISWDDRNRRLYVVHKGGEPYPKIAVMINNPETGINAWSEFSSAAYGFEATMSYQGALFFVLQGSRRRRTIAREQVSGDRDFSSMPQFDSAAFDFAVTIDGTTALVGNTLTLPPSMHSMHDAFYLYFADTFHGPYSKPKGNVGTIQVQSDIAEQLRASTEVKVFYPIHANLIPHDHVARNDRNYPLGRRRSAYKIVFNTEDTKNLRLKVGNRNDFYLYSNELHADKLSNQITVNGLGSIERFDSPLWELDQLASTTIKILNVETHT